MALWPLVDCDQGPLPVTVDAARGTITDTTTGLMWQKQMTLLQQTQAQAAAGCDNLTQAGHADWRLPTLIESVSINCAEAATAGFEGALEGTWTSTPSAFSTTGEYWTAGGGLYGLPAAASETRDVRCVRVSVAPTVPGTRYTLTTDTVTDEYTGLTWHRAISDMTEFAVDAATACNSATTAGFFDWRAPTLREVRSIVDITRITPAFDPQVFNVPTNFATQPAHSLNFLHAFSFPPFSGSANTAVHIKFGYTLNVDPNNSNTEERGGRYVCVRP